MGKLATLLPKRFLVLFCICGGVITGLIAYIVYMSSAFSYASDEPSACVNCHIMAPYYQSWSRSSHATVATCNDCHVPHNNVISKYSFKAKDGLYHAAVFTARLEPDVIRPRDASYEVIMKNCVRCHTELNTEFVKTGMAKYADVKNGNAKACWDCHRDVPHTTVSNLSSSPNAIVPLPKSLVPQWIKDLF